MLLEIGDEARKRVFAAIEDEVVSQRPLFAVDLCVRRDMGGIDDRHI